MATPDCSIDSKICSTCKEDKPLSEFRKNRTTKDGLQWFCKKCHDISSIAWQKKNKDRVKEIKRKCYIKNREKNLQYAKDWADKNKDKIKVWESANKEKVLETGRRWRKNHPEQRKAIKLDWERRNPEKKKLYDSRAGKKWSASNQDKKNATYARYRSAKLKASVRWANNCYMGLFYKFAYLESERTGSKVHVDHIVPLRSEIVCGLHCEDNLQLLFDKMNFSKGNKLWPDMP